MTGYLLVAITIISIGICYYAAKKRGLSEPYWIFIGALFGPLAIPFVFLAKSNHTNSMDICKGLVKAKKTTKAYDIGVVDWKET